MGFHAINATKKVENELPLVFGLGEEFLPFEGEALHSGLEGQKQEIHLAGKRKGGQMS